MKTENEIEAKRQKKVNAFTQLDIRREEIGDHPGIEDRKWYPIFEVTTSGLVFALTLYENWNSNSDADVGAPFVFKTLAAAAEFGKNNVTLYNDFFGF